MRCRSGAEFQHQRRPCLRHRGVEDESFLVADVDQEALVVTELVDDNHHA
jgi:hypothetical protein